MEHSLSKQAGMSAWHRGRWRLWERQLRAVLCWVVFFTMIAFYLPVVTAIQALLQVGCRPCPHAVLLLCSSYCATGVKNAALF